MSNLRNAQLLQQVQAHPLKATLARALDLAETFAGDVEFLQLDNNLSPEGRNNQRRAKLRAAIRDLRDVRAPINELQAKLDKKRAAVAIPPFDPKDVVGFLRRQELRAALRAMETGQRELMLNDPAFADAMLEQPAVLSGLFVAEDFKGAASAEIQRDRDIVAAAKQRRLETLFAPQLAEIEELEKTVSEATMIADLVRGDLKLHSGIEDQRKFEQFVKPIEAKQNACWLKRSTDFHGKEIIVVINPDGVSPARIATPDEVRDGVFFKDHGEYPAARAA